MTNAVIVEDEERNIELLKAMLHTHCSDLVTIQGFARNIEDAIALIKNTNPQLVYLDVELNQGNSFELLDRLDAINFRIIFITAFNEYAVRAFRYNAIDYLLKPISIQELREATEKAVKGKTDSSGNDALQKALKQLKASLGVTKIGIPVSDGIVFIHVDDIIKVEANGSYSVLYMSDRKKITSSRSLKDMEEQLPETSFLRVHHAWIINIKYLKKYYRGKNSYMEMEDGSTVQVSLRKKKSLLDFLNE